MGNFSRDPRLRAADSIAKHYVAVPLQQAVPVLDADWNEAENLRRHQHELLGARFIGSGVPAGEDGFRVGTVAVDNDFAIKRGTLLVEGKVVVNDADTTYVTQPNAALAPPLATPAADTPQIAYLDTWEREVDGQEDPALVDSRIGVETCVRLKTEWVVRVVNGADPGALPAPPAGHHFLPLARIRRVANDPRITYRAGNVRLTGTSHGGGVLVVTGNLEVLGNFSFDGLIVVMGNLIQASGSARVRGAVLQGPGASSVEMRGNFDLQYSSTALDFASATTGLYVAFNGWQELHRQ